MTKMVKKLVVVAVVTVLSGLGGYTLWSQSQSKWDPEFKAKIEKAIARNLTQDGIGEYADLIATCMVDQAEKDFSQAQMEKISTGQEETDHGYANFKRCACAIDPRAQAHPTFCKE